MLNDILNDIIELIRIPSVYSRDSKPGMPFGENIDRCLRKTLEIGEALGFRTKNYDGYAGEMDMGDGENILGILCHCDVVDAGEGWHIDPFEPVIKEGKLYGRGSADDKGPMVACMYAVRQLKDDGKIPADVTVRIIVGTNEEEDWNDIPYYLQKADFLPSVSIVPDAMFPLIYCEKGLYDIDLIYGPDDKTNILTDNGTVHIFLEELTCGSARNSVASGAKAVLVVNDKTAGQVALLLERCLKEKGYEGTITVTGNRIELILNGKSAHAMNPEKGINAAAQLLSVLSILPEDRFSHSGLTSAFSKLIGEEFSGEKAGLACCDRESGALTLNVGTVNKSVDGAVVMQISVRYPSSVPFEEIRERTYKGLGSCFLIKEINHMEPVYFRKDDGLISLLMDVYREVSGDYKAEPLAIGGATYARAMPEAVAFGPVFPWEAEMAHEPDEFVNISSLEKAQEIYYRAVERICIALHAGGGTVI